METKKLAVFGLSANPPHYGHIFIKEYLCSIFDKVVVVPCYQHVFNKQLISYEHRFAMTNLAIKSLPPSIYVSDVEKQIGGESIMANTIEWLKKFHCDHEFYFALGKDAYRDLDKWKERDKLLSLAKPFIVDSAPKLFPNIHSTEIRAYLRDGFVLAKQYLPPLVYQYIIDNKLY
jgi:nicotinate (nicotinamide) nucleotide adenylyltransferase